MIRYSQLDEIVQSSPTSKSLPLVHSHHSYLNISLYSIFMFTAQYCKLIIYHSILSASSCQSKHSNHFTSSIHRIFNVLFKTTIILHVIYNLTLFLLSIHTSNDNYNNDNNNNDVFCLFFSSIKTENLTVKSMDFGIRLSIFAEESHRYLCFNNKWSLVGSVSVYVLHVIIVYLYYINT